MFICYYFVNLLRGIESGSDFFDVKILIKICCIERLQY